jgi:histidine ammonia-lyase
MTNIFNYGTDHLTIGICLDIAAGKTKGIINKKLIKLSVPHGAR